MINEERDLKRLDALRWKSFHGEEGIESSLALFGKAKVRNIIL